METPSLYPAGILGACRTYSQFGNLAMGMPEDTDEAAERYDWIAQQEPGRKKFFRQVFADPEANEVLDCVFGTGRDLTVLGSFDCEVFTSDLSASMLAQAQKILPFAGTELPLIRANCR